MQNSWCLNGADGPRIYHLCRARHEMVMGTHGVLAVKPGCECSRLGTRIAAVLARMVLGVSCGARVGARCRSTQLAFPCMLLHGAAR
ncbi:MAG: hypothetical protein CBHOC_0122 [uncultured Caballeronia sp.]|nr:MAG: hypothetical protein CBHOC_0122 [uncultured Caballeronia sp.]